MFSQHLAPTIALNNLSDPSLGNHPTCDRRFWRHTRSRQDFKSLRPGHSEWQGERQLPGRQLNQGGGGAWFASCSTGRNFEVVAQ